MNTAALRGMRQMWRDAQPSERLVKVQIMFEGKDWYGIFKMKSPTGKVKSIRCNGRWRRFSQELVDLIASLDSAMPEEYRWGTWKSVLVPIRIMEEVKDLDQEGWVKAAKRPNR